MTLPAHTCRPWRGSAIAIAILFAMSACTTAEKKEFGVEVFADDTIPAKFTVELTGSLEVGLRSESFYMRPDRSLVLQTPAALVVQKGTGTMTIKSFNSAQRIAVEPIGTPPDSSERVAVMGTVVKVERVGEEKRVRVTAPKP